MRILVNTSNRPSILAGTLWVTMAGIGSLAVDSAQAQLCAGAFPDTITGLLSQDDVDTFQDDFGPCDRIDGYLTISPVNAPITDLSPLNGLVEIGQGLSVQGSFSTLDGLHNLTTVGDVSIEGTSPITDLTGLTNLSNVGGLTLVGLPQLENLSGAPNLATVHSLQLTGLSGLSDLSGMTGLTSLNSLNISIVPSLTDLAGLPAVLDFQSISITDTVELTSLDGLPVSENLEYVELDGNAMLVDISALASSTFVSDPPGETTMRIRFNFALPHLEGMPVGETFGSIQIESNPNMLSLTGLESLVEVWSNISIVNNDKLSDCSTLATVLDAVDDGEPGPGDGMNPDDPPDTLGLDYIQIADNGPEPGCNSIAEIVDGGANEIIESDGFEAISL